MENNCQYESDPFHCVLHEDLLHGHDDTLYHEMSSNFLKKAIHQAFILNVHCWLDYDNCIIIPQGMTKLIHENTAHPQCLCTG